MRYLNPAEIACLAEVIRPQYRALVFVGAYGGLRFGELAGLRRSRVDLDAGTVDVAENITEVQGKLQSGPPKTKASRRRVSLPGRRGRGAGGASAGAGPADRLCVPGAGRWAAADQRVPLSGMAPGRDGRWPAGAADP